MANQIAPIQDSFNAGEFGKRMEARVSFDKYVNAGATVENIMPLPQGGWTYRPGFRYVTSAKSASVRPWLIPFVFSTEQSYVIELGEQCIRWYRNQGQIAAPATNATITNGTFATNITGWTDSSAGTGAISHNSTLKALNLDGGGAGNEAKARQSVTTSNTGTLHVLKFYIAGDPGDTVTVRVGSTAGGSEYLSDANRQTGWHCVEFTPAASPFHVEFETALNKTVPVDDVSLLNNAPVELVTPWSEAQLPDISYAQSADVLYMCIGPVHPYKLERYGNASWSLVKVLFEDGPWKTENSTSTTLQLAAATGRGVNLTASATDGINDGEGFRTDDVGRLVRIEYSTDNWTWVQIVNYTSATVVVVDILGKDAGTGAVTGWRLGEWSDHTGWPSVVGFIQQRLGFAATSDSPQTFWLSKSAEIENFQDENDVGEVKADSSIAYTFAALQVNTIRWMASRKKPVIGTVGGNWTLRSDGAVLTPTDIAADFEVTTGVARIQPVEVRSRLLYAQAQKRKLLELADVLQDSGVQGFDAFDLTLLQDRVLRSGVTQLAYQQEPDSVVWCVREDGQTAALTYQPDQQVIGWSRHIHGGTFDTENAVIESVACIPGQDGAGQFKDSTERYEVWVAVKMTIDGSTVRYVEVLERLFNGDEDLQEEAFCVDSGVTLDSPLSIEGVTKANPGVVTITGHGLSNGALIRIVRVVGMTELNGNTYKVANVTSNTFQLTDEDDVNVNTTGFGTYVKNGQVREKVSVVSGLAHLEGETVQVFADGATQTEKTVASGQIALDSPAGLVHIGLAYTRTWRSLKLAYGGGPQGSAVGRLKNIADLTVAVMETAEGAFTWKTEEDGLVNEEAELDLRDAANLDADPVAFYTGEVRLGLETGFDRELRLVLTGNQPVPATVLAIVPEIETAMP
tara:strand:+ start:5187 stop:7922 length:2736 start_codon:yes stop_codon:yes gene_type:complete